jgi:hypothetical protein
MALGHDSRYDLPGREAEFREPALIRAATILSANPARSIRIEQ